jgi:dephospho-CoA kinase
MKKTDDFHEIFRGGRQIVLRFSEKGIDLKIVGLTGGIGAGKSTVARMLVARGARLIDADLLAREVVEPGKPAWRDIVEEFGEDVLNADRSINREALAAVVFKDEEKRERLNLITHPRIGEQMIALTNKYRDEGAQVVIIDAALLLESPATRWIKPAIVVVADDELKVDRVCARDRCGREEVLGRIRSQWTDEKRAGLADYVIDKSGDLASLEEQVEKVWKSILE